MGKYIFIDYETKERLAEMPDGSFNQAQEESDRLSEECSCRVIAIKVK
jgi:hypothetical protein